MGLVRAFGRGFAVLALLVAMAPAVNAQEGLAWIQLEALPDLTSAETRARAYSADLPQVSGFRMGTNWYLIALGPFSAAEAAGKMAALKSSGQIPSDAYISEGRDYEAQFWPVGAAAQSSAPDAPPSAAEVQLSDETPAAAQISESALPREAKTKLQEALQWYGFYDGALDGSFGRGTRASMAAWQTALGYEVTGILTTLQRDILVTNYNADAADFGFALVNEPEAGIEFSLPADLLTFDHYEPPFVHYVAKDGGKIRLLLISEPGDDDALAGLYDLLQTLDAVPSGGARALEGGAFTINAVSETAAAFATAKASKGVIKGYLLAWEPAQNDEAQRILAVMKSTFRSTGDQVLDPGLVPLDATVKSGVLAGMAVKQPKAIASGVYISSAGLVLTASELVGSCGKITLDGTIEADVAAMDNGLGAAVLQPLSQVSPIAVARLATSSLAVGAPVMVAGYSLPAGLPAPVLTEGRIEALGGPSNEAGLLMLGARITPFDVGGPVMDMQGVLVGMIKGTETGGKSLPAGMALAQDAASLAPLFAGLDLDAGAAPGALTPDALNAAAMGMTVQVACWP
jgi:peptidoglycan hydrolase-like protein with peptidoglycan-binding domain